MSSPTPTPSATTTTTTLPPDFLTGPAPPNLTTTRLDFLTSPLPVYTNCYATLIDHALTPSECATLLLHAHASTSPPGTWERAMVNMGGSRQALATETRNCGRIILDAPDLTARLWARIAPCVPELATALEGPRWCATPVKQWRGEEEERERGAWGSALHDRQVARGERWRCEGLNERMRFLRYVGGEYFRPHCDGAYVRPDGRERSFFTLHLYLNGGEEEGGGSPFEGEEGEPREKLRGGATTFHGPNDMFALQFGEPEDGVKRMRVDVEPKVGRVLIFQHRHMVHSGDDVVAGVKYTMRTDIMFEKEVNEEESK